MGCISASTTSAEQQLSDQIQIQLNIDKNVPLPWRSRRILVIGPKGSGKSTFYKQMRFLHGNGISADDRKTFREQIYRRTVQQMKCCIENVAELNRLSIRGRESARFMSTVTSTGYSCKGLMDALVLSGWLREQIENLCTFLPPELIMLFGSWLSIDCAHWMEVITAADCNMDNVVDNNKILMKAEVVSHIETLWKENAIRDVYRNRSTFHIDDSASHFFDDIARIGADDYIANRRDILLVPSGENNCKLSEFSFEYKDFNVQLLKMQSNDHKKWIHCFHQVRIIIFMASLSCYDDKESMLNSMEMFQDICASPWLPNSDFVLFLNKWDLFRDKLRTILLSTYFPEYEDCENVDENVNKAMMYIRERFVENANPKDIFGYRRSVYVHFTCATARDNVQFVFNDVMHIVSTPGPGERGTHFV